MCEHEHACQAEGCTVEALYVIFDRRTKVTTFYCEVHSQMSLSAQWN